MGDRLVGGVPVPSVSTLRSLGILSSTTPLPDLGDPIAL